MNGFLLVFLSIGFLALLYLLAVRAGWESRHLLPPELFRPGPL
jgi:hypothetical protein